MKPCASINFSISSKMIPTKSVLLFVDDDKQPSFEGYGDD